MHLQKLSFQVPEELPTLVDLPIPGPSISYLNEELPLSASTESTSDDSVVHGVDIEEVIHYLNLTPVKLGKVEHFSTNCTIKETQRYHRYVPQSTSTLAVHKISSRERTAMVSIVGSLQIDTSDVTKGSYIACMYDDKVWFGCGGVW